MNTLGYYDGRMMAFSFNLLRENDLFWSFFVNNYLKGERPAAFDLLYWNTDGTNLPAKMHSFYLRNMYLHNRLVEKDGIELDGVKIDLSQVETPSYFLSAAQDHIAKWQSTYRGAQLFKGDVKYVLAGSGHIAGVVNPPKANKYGYWLNDDMPADSDGWFKGAQKSTKKVASRKPGDKGMQVLEAAPGSYVSQSILDVIK